MTDFTQGGYVPPGLSINAVSLGSIAAVGTGTDVVCLVGEGIGYEVNTETVSFASSSAIALTKKFVDPDSIVVSAIMDDGPTVFVPDVVSPAATHDYSVTTSQDVTTVTRHNTGDLPTDRPVTISYHYADDGYFALNRFTDFQSLSAIYGTPLDATTGEIISPLSFAAQQAMRNGARTIYCIALDTRAGGSSVEQFNAAYTKLLTVYDINLVVPLLIDADDTSSASTYLSDFSSFLDTAYAESFPMLGLVGLGAAYATTDADTLATGTLSRRVVLVWPPALNFFNPVLNATSVADGIYAAAGLAGILVNQHVNRGLTQSQLKGFTGIPASALATMTTSRKNTWSSKGVSVIEPTRTGTLVVRHGVTTDVSDIGKREISVVRCQDNLLNNMRVTLESSQVIGDPITEDTPLMIESLIAGALENAKNNAVIRDYTNLTVSQGQPPGGDPTVITVTFTYYPIYPLNYVVVTFTLDLSTNTVSDVTANLATAA